MSKLHILNINLIAGRTGAARLAKTISEGLDPEKFEYHTIVGYDFGDDEKTTSIYKTCDTWLYKNLRYKLAVGLNFLFDWMTPGHIDLKFLESLSYWKDIDIIHLHSIQGGYFDWSILPELSKTKKIIMTLHDDWLVSGNDKNSLYFPYKTHKSYLKRKDIFTRSNIEYVGVSSWTTSKIKNDAIIGNNTARTIYNGINTSVFCKKDKEKSREKLGLPKDKKIILSIAGSGNKSNLKGLAFVMDIVEQYKTKKDILFITIGNHTENKVSDNFWELGWISSDMMAEYFSAADVFLYPTLADSFGLVVAESLACGCPVLTFNIGGVPELMKHKVNGYIANYKDAEDLQKGFEYILENREKLTVSLDDKFKQETMIVQYEELYKSLLM
ncbi:hypothetical protein COY60_04375 [Candidatus Gracilibacteria bacterium CG_4_10_14_0_8_um_filter_38_28]|nr:MAG: hypothetical protein COY60_04375 [Candidatus Gracilibacteria bacterium CG_4_10_14_0_8_um_filter_38_28]